MRTLKLLLLSLVVPLCFAQSSVIPLPPCTSNFTLSNTNLTGPTFPNSTPSCDKWTVTAYVVGTGSFNLTLQSAPPATTSTPGSWITYPGTVATGSNPLTATGIATFTNGTTATPFMRLLLNVTSGTATVYGVLQGSQTVVSKGGGGGGGGGGPTIAGTAGEIAATGAGCTTPSTATCTISIVTNAALPGAPTTTTAALGDNSTKIATTAFITNMLAGCVFTSGALSCPSTISSGAGSGATGALDLVGKTSAATSTITVDDANTATNVKLPNDATSGLYAVTSPTATPAAGCAQFNGTSTQAASTGTPCGSGGGTAGGGVLGFSATALTLPTAGTTFLAPIGGALASTTEANVTANAPAAAAISNMYVTLSSAPGTGNTVVFTFRDAGSSTAVTCTISGASATSCQDTTHTFTPVVGDALSIQVVTTGTVVITPAAKIIAEYGVMGGGGGGSPGGSFSEFQYRAGASTFGAATNTGPIPITSWSIVNGAVLSNFDQSSLGLYIPNNGSVNFGFATQPLTAAPYTVIAKLECVMTNPVQTGAEACALYLYDGTKFEGIEVFSGNTFPELQVRQAPNVTSGGSEPAGPTLNLVSPSSVVFKVTDDSTHRTWFYYSNGAFVQFFQEASGAFLTPTAVGFGGINTNTLTNSFLAMNLDYWCVSAATTCNGN